MAADPALRQCPYCKEEIRADAIRCKHCRSSVPAEKPGHGGTCPYCKETIHPEAVKCKHCGSMVGPQAGCGCSDNKTVAASAGSTMQGIAFSRATGGAGDTLPPPVMTAEKTTCSECTYGGMVDPFAGVSYGQQTCCRTYPVTILGHTYMERICWNNICGTRPFPVFNGWPIWA